MARLALTVSRIAAIRQNLFHAAHPAIGDWQVFDWHCDSRGQPQADKVQSSQALAIDVFGSVKAASNPARDAILDALAARAGLPSGGPWNVELEWCDPDNLLNEPRQTQVDAIAFGAHAILVIECKFTEAGGSCSQTNKLTRGPGRGLRQCNGRYETQTHPVSGVEARCTLSGKGIRYWDVIPRVFALDPSEAYAPCPFSGESFQWMRNMVLASELARHHNLPVRCMVVYAAGGEFTTERKAANLDWLPPIADGQEAPLAMSYQDIVAMAGSVDDNPIWSELGLWINHKVEAVRRMGR